MTPGVLNASKLADVAVRQTELLTVTGGSSRSESSKRSCITSPTGVTTGLVSVTVATVEVADELLQATLTIARYWLPVSASDRFGVV